MGSLILASLAVSVLLLCNHWSVNYHETICYAQLKGDQVSLCTHVKVRIENRKQNVVKRFIVPIIERPVQTSPGNYIVAHQVEVQKKKFNYSSNKKTFTQIPYPIDDCIEFY